MVVGMTLFNGLVTPARQYAGAGCVPASLEWFIEYVTGLPCTYRLADLIVLVRTVHPNNVF